MGKYFGTDGIRGVYGVDLTDDTALLTGNALAKLKEKAVVVLGRDTRISGENLSSKIIEGVTKAGGSVVNLNIIPTPAVAYITKLFKADFGVVISASHNPHNYNGIKIFNHQGVKLTETEEKQIEEHLDLKALKIVDKAKFGKITSRMEQINEYFNFIVKSARCDLKGMKVVLDCSNGAVYDIAPHAFRALGAEVIAVNDKNDGANINNNCGALYPERIASLVKENKADMGFSFDGDADRVIGMDEKGNIVNGDSIIYAIALDLKDRGLLNNMTAVGTLHTNMGIEHSLLKHGIKLVRTDIGDHHVVERMLKDNLMVGGEQSGHIILRQFSDTGDGLLAAVNIACLVKTKKVKYSELCDATHYPQVNINIIVKDKSLVMNNENLMKIKSDCEKELIGKGRILLRASGTEPKVRIMVECSDNELALKLAEKMKAYIDKIK